MKIKVEVLWKFYKFQIEGWIISNIKDERRINVYKQFIFFTNWKYINNSTFNIKKHYLRWTNKRNFVLKINIEEINIIVIYKTPGP